MRFYYFTYFLNPTKEVTLLDGNKNKKDIIVEILNKRIDCGQGIVYLFSNKYGECIHGKIGRQGNIKIHEVGEDQFIEKSIETYPNCNIFFYTNDEKGFNGQKIALQVDNEVYRNPNLFMSKIEEALNRHLYLHGYAININPVLNIDKFWDAIDKYDGKIDRITLNYAVPNLFGINNSLESDLKNDAKKYGATNVSLVFENKNGELKLNKEDKLLNESAQYISNGGGSFKIKAKGVKAEFNSSKDIKTISIEEAIVESTNQSILEKICAKLFYNL